MNKENKIFTYIILSIIVFFFSLAIFVNYISGIIDQKIELIKIEAEEVIEGIECEFTYKDIHYNGICTTELIDNTAELIAYDKQLELMELCMKQPYAHRYKLCEEVLE